MTLSQLKLTNDKRPVPAFRRTGVEKARSAILGAIEVQRILVSAERNGTSANLTKSITKVDEHGNKTLATVDRHPRKWFFTRPSDGKYVVEVLFANHPVLINGKQSVIEAGDLDGVDKVLNIIATATEQGELDKALADISSKRKTRKKAA